MLIDFFISNCSLLFFLNKLKKINFNFKKEYLLGGFFIILLNFISATNDMMMRFLGSEIDPVEVSFFRAFFTVISLIPFCIFFGKPKEILKTRMPVIQIFRGAVGAIAIFTAAKSVTKLPLLENTCLMFAEPILFIPLGIIFLKEKFNSKRLLGMIFSFFGILLICFSDLRVMNFWFLISLISSLMFATLSVFGKKLIEKNENILTSLLYFGILSSLILLIPTLFLWKAPSIKNLMLFFLLGVNGNLMQFLMFKAYKLSDVSRLMPLRYSEMLFTAAIDTLIFNQKPTTVLIISGIIIIAGSFFSLLVEGRKE